MKIGTLLGRRGVDVPYRTLHRFVVACCGFGCKDEPVRVELRLDFGNVASRSAKRSGAPEGGGTTTTPVAASGARGIRAGHGLIRRDSSRLMAWMRTSSSGGRASWRASTVG